MTNRLKCPECGNDEFGQNRTTSYDEYCVVSFSLRGEVEDERIESQEGGTEEFAEAHECCQCGWQLVDENFDPITEPDEVVAAFESARLAYQKRTASPQYQKELERTNCSEVKMTGGTGSLPDGYFGNSQGKSDGDAVEQVAASGFDLGPLPNGDVLIEFFGDDGQTFNSQVITRKSLARFPVVIHTFFLAMEKGPDAAAEFLDNVTGMEGKSHGGDDKMPANRSGGDQ